MKNLCTLLTLFLFSVSMYAQSKTVSGTVKDGDTGEPLIGVNIVVKDNADKGAITDFDGKYSIEVEEAAQTLIFSYIGFEDKEVDINGRETINLKMGGSAIALDQVVISASKKKEKILNAPASVSVITAERIQNQTSLTAVDNMKKTPGVDIMSTGLVSSNVSLRGFNGIFGGSMLTMVDNRIGRVPSLRVNAFQLIPGNNYDIQKIEVVRGPGSALYGPNAADGVMHIITKSPIDIEGKHETNISMTTGMRSVILDAPAGADFSKGDIRLIYKPEIRTAIKFSEKAGLKLSGKYMTGEDWENYDDREPVIGQPMVFGTVQDGNVWQKDESRASQLFDRDFTIKNWNGDARFDLRPTKDTEIILAGGLSNSENLELTGLGASQVEGWKYWYAQSRFRWKKLFAQYFVNSSNAGNGTYLIPQGTNPEDTLQMQLLIDKSKLHVVQLQHSSDIKKLQLIYGTDILLTRPNTEGSINGRFEDDDNINQYGAYLQAEYEFNSHWKVVGAGRVDYHDVIQEVQVSPRAAVVYKPNPMHTIRATYNKAFSTPSSLNLSLDLANGVHPLWNGQPGNPFNTQEVLMNIRGIGNPNGYNYNFGGADGALLYKNFWDGEQYTLDQTENNHVYFDNMVNLLTAQLAGSVDPTLAPLVPFIVGTLMTGIAGEDGTIQDASLAGIDFVEFLETGDHAGSLWDGTGDLSNLKNHERTKSETTETYEMGYKGILKDKLFLSVDGYYTVKKNLRSALLNESPYVVFNPNDLNTIFGMDGTDATLEQNLAVVEQIISDATGGTGSLAALLEGNPAYVVTEDGNAYDELVKALQDANAQLGLGLVTPNDGKVNDDMILTYTNLGNVKLWGADLGFTFVATDDIQVNGAYSFVNKDEIEVSTGGTVALNAPKNKVSLGYDHFVSKIGLGYGLNGRWYQGFPANSAVYIGDVDAYYTADAKVFYRPKKMEQFQVTLDVQNITGNKYRTFPGTPLMGRIAFLKLAYTIK